MIAPTLVLWLLAGIVTTTLVHPFDVVEYQRYAHAALHAPLLHRLPLEYPAPALAVFVLPLALPLAYPWAFAVLMGVALVALAVGYAGSGVPGWDLQAAGRLLLYVALGAVVVVAGRYDIVAVVAMFWAVRAARRDRWSSAWTWCTVGFALKLFPAVLWPVFLIAEWRQRRRLPVRRLWWMAASLVVVVAVPLALDSGATLNALRYYLHRPVELGSLPAGLSLLAGFHSTTWVSSFHSQNLVNAWSAPLAAAVELAGAAGCVWTWWSQARGRLSLTAACLATLSFVVLGSKVLSIQYLMWLMPLWALYRVRAAWALAAAANLAVFVFVEAATGFGYLSRSAFEVTLTLIYFARDVLMVVGTVSWLHAEYARAGAAREVEVEGAVADADEGQPEPLEPSAAVASASADAALAGGVERRHLGAVPVGAGGTEG